MEALVMIFAGILGELFLAFGVIGAQLVAGIIGLVLEIGFGLTTREQDKSKLSEKAKIRMRRIFRWTAVILLPLAALITGIVLILDRAYLPEVTRWVLDRVETRTDYKVEFDDVSGSLLFGNLQMAGIHVSREGVLDLQVETFEAKWGLVDLLIGDVHVDRLDVQQVRGTIVKKDGGTPNKAAPRKSFVVTDFNIQEVAIELMDQDEVISLEASLKAAPLDSRCPVWTLLFRSNGHITLNGTRLSVVTRKIDGGMLTEWSCEGMPVSLVSKWVKYPFSMFEEGTVDISLHDRWQHKDYIDINTDIAIEIHDSHMTTPKHLAYLAPAVAYLNTQNPMSLTFQLVANEDELSLDASTGMTQLWDAYGIAFMTGITKQFELKDTGESLWQKAKQFAVETIDDARKRDETPPPD